MIEFSSRQFGYGALLRKCSCSWSPKTYGSVGSTCAPHFELHDHD